MMRVALDIGGCISKFPKEFSELALKLQNSGSEIFVITDMHDMEDIYQMLDDNGFDFIPKSNVYSADYKQHGEMCKAVLLKELKIDILIDDFMGYLQWDETLGSAPIRLLVMPDAFKPYWHENWKTKCDSDFGRRVTKSV